MGTQGIGKMIDPKDNLEVKKTNPNPLPRSRPKETQKDSGIEEVVSEDMEIGYLDLDWMEVACSKKYPALIPPQQVSLLEKDIIQAKKASSLGVVVETLKVTEGKKNVKKDKRGRPRNVQRIRSIGEQLVALGKYPTIDAALSPSI